MTFSESGFRWFRRGITLGLIIVCNLVLLGALWLSDLNLDFALNSSELYDPELSYCVGVAWADVSGVDGPVRVCSEWLDTTDPTGRVHSLRAEEPLAMSADGNLYYENARNADRWALGLASLTVAVMYLGMRTKRELLTWYETRLRKHES